MIAASCCMISNPAYFAIRKCRNYSSVQTLERCALIFIIDVVLIVQLGR